MRARRHDSGAERRGGILVESALLLPVMTLMMLGAADLGWWLARAALVKGVAATLSETLMNGDAHRDPSDLLATLASATGGVIDPARTQILEQRAVYPRADGSIGAVSLYTLIVPVPTAMFGARSIAARVLGP